MTANRYSYTSSSMDAANRRFARAATVGPCASNVHDISYYGYMPFNRQLKDIEDR